MEGTGKDEENSQVDTFISITSASREEALFFLESHNFQLDSAIHSFFENNAPIDDPQGQELGQDFDHREAEEEAEEAAAIPQSSPARSSIPIFPGRSAMSSRDDKKKKASSRPSGSRGGIRTLADLNRRPDAGSDSDDDDAPQEYYTGGEKSGMLVQEPTRGGHNVDAIFDQARQMGAQQGPFEQHPSSGSRSFTGTGRLLSGETVPAARPPPQNVTHNIYFWSNGFSVDDGPLRRFDDPANASFLESIKNSECPKELEPEDRRSMVHVNLIRRGEDYSEPVKRSTPFHGIGRTLGGGSSSTDSIAHEPAAAASSPSVVAPLAVDESRPMTSIQLRLADGSRTVARFNTSHTIGDIRLFINHHSTSHGRAVPPTYTLQTVGFPPKQLNDTTLTIEQAGLANSVVIQKL